MRQEEITSIVRMTMAVGPFWGVHSVGLEKDSQSWLWGTSLYQTNSHWTQLEKLDKIIFKTYLKVLECYHGSQDMRGQDLGRRKIEMRQVIILLFLSRNLLIFKRHRAKLLRSQAESSCLEACFCQVHKAEETPKRREVQRSKLNIPPL